MATVFDVADFFIDTALHDPDNHMTNMRVNKLLYFAQGWSLARRGLPLFSDDFEAWPYGPVVPRIYQSLKISGSEKVHGVMSDNYSDHIVQEEQRLLLDVLHEYDKYSTSGLVGLSHAEGSPWAKAIHSCEGAVIPKADIRDYFLKLPPLREFRLPRLTRQNVVGYRDKVSGNYVLPKEWDDGSL